jgi:GMP synthase-like glutamine amidotransferase
MQMHIFQHVPFEGPAGVESWADARGYALTTTRFFENDMPPSINDLDWLVVMGGPMNIYEEDQYPWLKAEKAVLRKAIAGGKTVIGICLGAQLIADALGAQVFQGEHKEIGWFPIELTPAGEESEIFGFLPRCLPVFHWHGDTFTLPAGAVHLARSEGCENQAFLYDGRVLGLQFHLESTPASVRDIVRHCRNEIVPAKYVQSTDAMLSVPSSHFQRINEALFGILERLPV